MLEMKKDVNSIIYFSMIKEKKLEKRTWQTQCKQEVNNKDRKEKNKMERQMIEKTDDG